MSIGLKNVMEEIVLSKADEIMAKIDCCKCEHCRLDIASYVLNRVPAKYVASSEGRLISKLSSVDKEFEIHLITEIVKAIQIVGAKPHHKVETN